MRFALFLVALAGCSTSSAGNTTYLDPSCPVAGSMPDCSCGCGTHGPDPCDATPQPQPITCSQIPPECADNLTCECIACRVPPCSCTGGEGKHCRYDPDAGRFYVVCVLP